MPYVPSLDGLRALAIVAVIAYHLGYLRGGYLGVDLFFVVSGYLITTLLLAERDRRGTVSLRSFWASRARRLLPTLLVVVVAVMVATRCWEPSWRWTTIRGDAFATLLYVQNWHLIVSGTSYFDGASPFRHAWSLSLEEQFYLVWPLVVVAVVAGAKRRTRLGVGLVASVGAVASAVWMAVLARGNPDPARLSRLYLGTDTRAMTVLTGVVLAVVVAWLRDDRRARGLADWRRVAAVVALPALALAVVMVARAGNVNVRMYRGGFVVFALVSASLVLACVGGVGPLAVLLAVRPLRWIGRLSYALYLWSWPVQVFGIDRFGLHGRGLVLAVGVVSTVLAVLTTELVEHPIRHGVRLRGRRWVGPTAFAACAALVVGLAADGAAAPDYTRVSDQTVAAAALNPFDRASQGGAAPVVMVTGDSVAWSMGWEMSDAVPGVRIDDRAMIGCGTMPAGTEWIARDLSEPQPYPPTCRLQARAEAAGLAAHPNVVVLGVGAWEVYDQLYEGRRLRAGGDALRRLVVARLDQRIGTYLAAGAQVIVPLVACYGRMLPPHGPERHDPKLRAWMNGILWEVAARRGPRVTVVDPTSLLCNDGGTRVRHYAGLTDGVPRPDGAHYDLPGRRWLWAHFLSPAVHRVLAPPPPR